MKRRFLTVLLTAALIFTMCTPAAFASSKKVKMTTYNVVKSGNTVYCPATGDGIYKVTLNNGQVINVQWLVKTDFFMEPDSYITSMAKKGKYLYYIQWTEGTITYLYRVNTLTRKKEKVALNAEKYAIKKNKLYAKICTMKDDGVKTRYKVMKLNGKAAKKTPVRIKMKTKQSNAEGYSVYYTQRGYYYYTYLRTPAGNFEIGKVYDEYAEW